LTVGIVALTIEPVSIEIFSRALQARGIPSIDADIRGQGFSAVVPAKRSASRDP
jgi:hypothetical protein